MRPRFVMVDGKLISDDNMDPDVLYRELKHQLDVNIEEHDPCLGMVFKPRIFVFDEYRTLAEESPQWLVYAKSWLVSDWDAHAGQVIEYASAGVMREDAPMKYVYSSIDMNTLVEMVPRIAAALMLQEFEMIDKYDEQQLKACLNVERLAQVIAGYVALICLVNPFYGSLNFDELFTRFWWGYFDSFTCNMEHFFFDAEFWRECWRGCLFFEK